MTVPGYDCGMKAILRTILQTVVAIFSALCLMHVLNGWPIRWCFFASDLCSFLSSAIVFGLPAVQYLFCSKSSQVLVSRTTLLCASVGFLSGFLSDFFAYLGLISSLVLCVSISVLYLQFARLLIGLYRYGKGLTLRLVEKYSY